jgi:hypothetical protein
MDSKGRQFAGLIRRCLTARFILRSRNQELFSLLAQSHDELNRYFGKMGAELVLNEHLGIAHLSVLQEWDEEIPYRLGRNRVLSAWETLALVHLRHKRIEFFSGTIDSEMPRISRQELRESLKEFDSSSEDRRFESQFNGIIKTLKDHQILISSDDQVFEITPVCDVLLPADQLQGLLERARAYFAVGVVTEEVSS